MGKTTIEWTATYHDDGTVTPGFTINPFRARNIATGSVGHYCVKISPGCKFCYSSRTQPRFGLFPFLAENRNKVELFLDESKLQDVLRRKIPTKYFWCDMTDMFLEDYPDEWIDRCFAVMALTPWHTHQVLTKRAGRMLDWAERPFQNDRIWNQVTKYQDWVFASHLQGKWFPLPNVWLGVSVENREMLARVDTLRETPAAVRFLSIEPLLEDIGVLDLRGIDWVIIGGESGPNARDFHVDWAMKIIAQCKAAGVDCFMKQFGSTPKGRSDADLLWLVELDLKGGNWEYWPEEFRVRQFPARPLLGASESIAPNSRSAQDGPNPQRLGYL